MKKAEGFINQKKPKKDNNINLKIFSLQCHERPSSFASTKLVNAEQVEHLIKDVILSHWKLIQKKCRLEDPDCTGCIKPEKFKGLEIFFLN